MKTRARRTSTLSVVVYVDADILMFFAGALQSPVVERDMSRYFSVYTSMLNRAPSYCILTHRDARDHDMACLFWNVLVHVFENEARGQAPQNHFRGNSKLVMICSSNSKPHLDDPGFVHGVRVQRMVSSDA